MEQKRHLTLGCQILGFNFVNTQETLKWTGVKMNQSVKRLGKLNGRLEKTFSRRQASHRTTAWAGRNSKHTVCKSLN